MSAIAAWFATSRLGRWLAAAGAIALAIGIAVLKLLAMGRAQERATQQKAKLQAISQRKKSDEDVDRMRAADVDQSLRKWMRDGR
ncbi:hypothetical protein OSH11_11575 [Kaistia dalseonensis]|uniref:Type VI protein secretion system component VasK n=1 Tax=Kaistia dalseonensis TaxID=410840 RepID=A0ABU0H833_9HYPH|nr:hypothetical protein [Kaistia dalseonensis]MCX5495349.1 hypothetical protein [Kaistia dalseonensis]MDQ0437935.1 type VI protein secretion system component VasK [Kaistia dalseonensis]